ncbi:hypothetical protein [Luteolibacter luteus]|uniref:Uncharacterized protein n=1 Tax=Luteolibacter luteus TaxID=2728835 RepID=A0A858RDX3_9BACT|nr:hypothetical protein [Luteolibacter luteus]QJE94997.1 hypothetical protein HHL09_04145 [Luteolibacter luteus]
MSGNLKIFGAFLSGAALAVGCVMIWQPNQTHAREETKMAYVNREIAMERGDRGMQTYFEEVIAWNAHMHLSPRFFDGVSKIDWLDKEVEAPPISPDEGWDFLRGAAALDEGGEVGLKRIVP